MEFTMRNSISVLAWFGFVVGIVSCQTQTKNNEAMLRQYACHQTLYVASRKVRERNDQALRVIQKKSGKIEPARTLKILKRAEELRKRTTQLTSMLSKVALRLVLEAGGELLPETHRPRFPLEKEKTKAIMLEEATKVKQQLDAYTKYVNTSFRDLDLPWTNVNLIRTKADFYDTYYKHATLVDVLINLAQSELKAVLCEGEIMEGIRQVLSE